MRSSQKNFIIMIFVLLLGFIITFVPFLYNENKSFVNELELNKSIIDSIEKKLLQRNKEIIRLLNSNIDSSNNTINVKSNDPKNIDGILLNEKPISIKQLIDIANKYFDNNVILKSKGKKDSLTISNLNSIISQLEKNKVLTKTSSGKYTYVANVDSLLNMKVIENNNFKSDLQTSKMALELIKNNYDIDSQIKFEGDKVKVTLINTGKLDSALMLYPYFKQKIKKNKKGETVIRY